MPVLRSKTEWTTRRGRTRVIRLYRSYKNMIGRVRGWNYDGCGVKRWMGLQCEFLTFSEFRLWALANGYCKARNSLDRIDQTQGYLRDNMRWISVAQNTARTHTGKHTYSG